MKLHNLSLKNITLMLSTLALASTATFSHAAVEGLELLEKIGTEKMELKTYYATTPTATELGERNKLGSLMGRVNGVAFNQDKPLRLNETRTAFASDAEPSATFEVDSRTGNFLFNGGLLKYRKEISTPNLPQESDLPGIASKALAQFGLRVDPAQMEIAHIGGLNLAIADGSGKSEVFEKLKTIRLGRTLDGLRVEGDARIVMQLGEEGTLAGMVFQWPNIGKAVALGSEHLQKPDAIRESALREIKAMSRKALRAELTRADLVLYDDGQGVMEPAYHFVMERHFDDGELEPVMIPYDFYVPATVKPAAFYPHMEVAPTAPADGSDTRAIRSLSNG